MKLVYALSAVAAFSSNVVASRPSTTDANRVLKAATKRVDLYRRSVRITRRFETELVYVDNENVWSDRPTFASQVKVSSQKPVLNLEEHEHHLQSVECGKDAIKLHFVDASSARDARAACHHNGAGLIITSHEGCNDEGERSVYRVNDVSFAKDGEALEVSAAKTTWQDAFDHVNVTFGHTTEDHIYRRHADFAKIREKRQNRVSIPGNTPDNVNTVNFNLSSEVVDKTFATADFLDIIGAVAPLPELPIAVPIELGCKRCATTGQLSLSQGAFNIDLSQIDLIPDIFQGGDDGKEISSVITGGFVELQAIGVGARLELFARPSANGMFEVALFQVPIAGFVIPGIGQAGAIFEPRVRFEFQVTGGIEVTAGLDLKVPDNSRLRVELTNLGKSELVGFQDTSLTPLPVNVNITDVDIVLGLAFKPAIPVGFEFFNQIKAEVTATLELPRLDAKLSTNIAGECGNGTRNGTAPPPPPGLAPPAPAPPALGPTAPAPPSLGPTAPAHSAPAPSAPALYPPAPYAPAPYAPAPPALEPYKNYTKRQLPVKPIALGPIALVSANVSVSCDIGLDVSIPILPPPFNAVKVSQNIFKAQLELVKECSSPEAAFKNSRAMRIPPPPPPAITAEAMNGTMTNGTISSMTMGRLNATATHGGFSALPYPAMTYTEAAPFAKATPPANATAPYVAGTLAKHTPAPYVAYTAPPYATTNHTSTTVMAQQTMASSAAHILSSSSAKHLVSSKAVSNHTATAAASTSSKMSPPSPPMLNHTSTAVLAASSSSDCATPSTTHVTITETVTSTLTRQLTQNVTATTTAKITEATTLPSAFSFSLFSTVTIEEEKSSSAAAVVSSSSKPVFTPPPPPPASSSMAMSSSSSSSSSKEVVAPPPLFTLSLGSSMMASSSSVVAEVTSSAAKLESSTAATVESSSMMTSSASASSTPAASSSSSSAASSTPEATSTPAAAATSAPPPTTSAVQPAPIMSRPPESLPELEATVTMGAGFLVPTNGTALPARANATGITEFTGAGTMNRGSAGQVMVWVVSMVVGVVGVWML